MRIGIWSHVVCPWCAVSFGSVAAAIAEFAHPVDVRWHPFEFDSSAPDVIEGDYVDALSEKYGNARTHTLRWVDDMRSRL